MSHFSVLVITTEKPTEAVLSKTLAPWHEFECTGLDNEYVQDIDQTEEVRESYVKSTASRLRSPDGEMHDPYDDKFYRDPTEDEAKEIGPLAGTGCGKGLSWTSMDWGDGKGYRPKIRFVPEGYEEVEIPRREVETLAEYADSYYGKPAVKHGEAPDLEGEHKYGYTLLDEHGRVAKVVDRTNPDKRWDWHVVGGRWRGRLLAKADAYAIAGRPGVFGNEPRRQGGVDICRKGDLDLSRMKEAAIRERAESWQEVLKRAQEKGFAKPHEGEALDQIRRQYHNRSREEIEAWKATSAAWKEGDPKLDRRQHFETFMGDLHAYRDVFVEFMDPITTDLDVPIGDWINAAPAFTAFAVVKDGKWYENGEMGWWGVVIDEKDEDVWTREFGKLVAETPDDHWFTIVDCHI